MNIKEHLKPYLHQDMQVADIDIDPTQIKAILINEVVPSHPSQDFYGDCGEAYLCTTIPLFQKANERIECIDDILNLGIYITNAVKTPKLQTTISKGCIEESLIVLEKELALFPSVRVIMLMGDVAKKAFNMIVKKQTKHIVVPNISTYKLRNTPLYYNNIRIFPSYIMTGKNIQIEKSKVEMASQDIAAMLDIISS